MRRGIPLNELALAYELRHEGCTWKRIALGLGWDWRALRDEVLQRIAGRVEDPRAKISDWVVAQAARQKQASGLTWRAIAAHYGVDPASLRFAVARRAGRCKG